jgi:hypothetical protein
MVMTLRQRVEYGTNGVVNFIWKGQCSEKQAIQHIFYYLYNNDSKPVALKLGKSPGFPCRFKNAGL